jgi:hypothetical protein
MLRCYSLRYASWRRLCEVKVCNLCGKQAPWPLLQQGIMTVPKARTCLTLDLLHDYHDSIVVSYCCLSICSALRQLQLMMVRWPFCMWLGAVTRFIGGEVP